MHSAHWCIVFFYDYSDHDHNEYATRTLVTLQDPSNRHPTQRNRKQLYARA
jgi:hypothetical protein